MKRILSFLLAIVMIVPVFGQIQVGAASTGITLDQVKEIYPDITYVDTFYDGTAADDYGNIAKAYHCYKVADFQYLFFKGNTLVEDKQLHNMLCNVAMLNFYKEDLVSLSDHLSIAANWKEAIEGDLLNRAVNEIGTLLAKVGGKLTDVYLGASLAGEKAAEMGAKELAKIILEEGSDALVKRCINIELLLANFQSLLLVEFLDEMEKASVGVTAVDSAINDILMPELSEKAKKTTHAAQSFRENADKLELYSNMINLLWAEYDTIRVTPEKYLFDCFDAWFDGAPGYAVTLSEALTSIAQDPSQLEKLKKTEDILSVLAEVTDSPYADLLGSIDDIEAVADLFPVLYEVGNAAKKPIYTSALYEVNSGKALDKVVAKCSSEPSTSTYTTGTYTPMYYDGCNIRSGPSTTYSVVGAIAYGTHFNVTQVSDNWGYTTCNGISGWVCLDNANYVGVTITETNESQYSSYYQKSPYYNALKNVKLTGNPAEDIANIAYSQIGYHEGNSVSELGGSNTSGSENYSEAGYWFGTQVKGNTYGHYYDWCAMFVAWCARQANIPTSIISNAAYASASNTIYCFNNLVFTSREDATPQKGDLIFFGDWDHVGIVYEVSNGYVTTVEGNASEQVKKITYSLNNTSIKGYGRPDYKNVPTTDSSNVSSPTNSTGTLSTKQIQLLEYVLGKVGTSYPSNACQSFVWRMYYDMDICDESRCCARNAASSWRESTSTSDIPIGAAVYFSGSSIQCSYCGNMCGHVGIYVGDGYMVHAWDSGDSVICKDKISTIDSYASYDYIGWGWNGGCDLTELYPSINYASISEGDYTINCGSSYLTSPADTSSSDEGGDMSVSAQSNSSTQIFNIAKSGSGYILTAKNSPYGKVVNIWRDGTAENGDNVTLYKKNDGSLTQLWLFEKKDSAYVIRSASNPNLALTMNGSDINVSTCTYASNQLWYLSFVDDNIQWGEWSDWSTTEPTASDTIQVESKTQYGYYHYILDYGDGNYGAYPINAEEFNEFVPEWPTTEEAYHTKYFDSQLSIVTTLTYGSTSYNCYPNSCCSDSYSYDNGSNASYLYYLGTRVVYRSRTKIPDTISVTDVTLNKTFVSFNVGATDTLTATVSPSNATNKAVTWTSSDPSVATVSNGVITAIAPGSAVITVMTVDGEKTATCNLTVSCSHSYDDGVITTEPTVDADGVKTFTCAVCGGTKTESVPKLEAPQEPVESDGRIYTVCEGGKIGQTVTVDFYLETEKDVRMLSVYDIIYSEDVLEFVSLEWAVVNSTFTDWSDEIATVLMGENANISGKLFTVTFKIKDGAADGFYNIDFANVVKYSVSGQEDVALNITSEKGNIEVYSIDPGDANGDEVINADDAVLLLKSIMLPDRYEVLCESDINGDGIFNADDVVYLLKHIMLPDRYPLL